MVDVNKTKDELIAEFFAEQNRKLELTHKAMRPLVERVAEIVSRAVDKKLKEMDEESSDG